MPGVYILLVMCGRRCPSCAEGGSSGDCGGRGLPETRSTVHPKVPEVGGKETIVDPYGPDGGHSNVAQTCGAPTDGKVMG